ncbi:MAG: aspartate carbamoyltransferase catalytic subunit [Myxococcales bacterium]|nr:aspartate carbamoyltransferase catalytic subunit [Deltaproteobacteria bacterium]NND28662.1 aspartate carbamoyltransferase catalytic subunit [Myxococcales bacterium]MBT8481872.1 aspartate carbamoyltransferase catalytic subunit [Deltaproteobacteria bacterium]NNK43706.1 aspartate carbamoyltransferase catalytic subunit [Myxococcales bacterium]NNL24734.1 aspartate carbamoyltransferase catalytic subunit [Myxococcales bacterium]
MEPFAHRSLLDVEGLTKADVNRILDTAEAFLQVSRRPVRKVPTLRGKTVINLFYEASTRTRTSFELAGKRLSADVINMSVSASSVKKGETLQDTCRTLQAMHPDVIVIRHASSGAPNYVASKIGCSVINAGDGMHAHPTQALLDAFTIRRAKGTLDNLVVAIVGDIAHSRVARSNAHLLKLFGCEVRVVGPRTLLPAAADSLGVRVFDALEDGLAGADVVMVLRIQSERLEGALLPSLREYARTFGIGPVTIGPAKPDAIIMHPGPMNRGVEIESLIADGERSVVLQQVEAGVAVRMALLYLLAGEATDTLAEGEVH